MMVFNSLLPIGLVVSALLLLNVFFIWLEWRRKQSLRVLRIMSVCLMILALAGLILQPAYEVEKSSSVILLTPNYDQTKVDSLLLLNSSATLKHIEGAKSYKGSKPLSYSELPTIQDDIQFVIGEGLPNHALDLLEHKTFQFISSDKTEGITQLVIDESILANRKNTINGLYYNESGKTRIVLKGPAGREDSILIEKTGDQPFQLTFQPKQSGNVSYELILKKTDGNTSSEILPLHIEESKPLRILFLQSYPTFETQYLKNFLTAKGHQLVLRYQLSKNNFRFEYGNLPSQQFNRLTSELLNRFDLVMLDANELKTLSASEQTVLHESIQNGLGILMLNVDPSKETKGRINFFPFQVQKIKSDTASLVVTKTSFALPALPYRVNESSSVKSIVENKSGILSGYKNQGLGKIGFQFLQKTYQLTLTGDSISYSNLWSPVIENISMHNISLSKIKINTSFPVYQDDPIDFEIISSVENPVLVADSIQIPLQENVMLDDVWHGRMWAAEAGWHMIHVQDAFHYYYVSKAQEWKSITVAQQIKANQVLSHALEAIPSEKLMESKMVDPIYFYLLFILTAGFLWLAPKL
ncbi:MAG: hypothetical protein ABI663_19220 [Chryseolinea sp.]